jgi:hypothetical protein
MKKILLIDDNPAGVQEQTIVELKKKFEVCIVMSYDAAKYKIDQIRTGEITFDLIILDILMPIPKHLTKEETKGGLETGIVLYDKELFNLDLPIFIWSKISYNKIWGENVKNIVEKDPLVDRLVTEVEIFFKSQKNGN